MPASSYAAEQLRGRIEALVRAPTRLMEVCGTHTMAIGRFGLRELMPRDLRLVSGPGCPVCVTPCETIDRAIAMAREPGVTLASFGDMMRVPGSVSSFQHERARGSDIRVVASCLDALEMARAEPGRSMVLLGVGFETTSPTAAATLVRARQLGVSNFFVLPAFKLIAPAMEALVASGDGRIQGFLCPGHVSVVTGSSVYERLADKHGVPCVITGFEALDILSGVVALLEQIAQGRAEVQIQYRRAVKPQGNPVARKLLRLVFRVTDAHWRGIGPIPASGLELSEDFSRFGARERFPIDVGPAADTPAGCACGDIMRGLTEPPGCALFGSACRPSTPVGPCMVSSEGACAAFYRFGSEPPGPQP